MASKPSGRNVAQDSVRDLITREQWDAWALATWEIATSGTKPEYSHCPKCGVKVKLDRVDLMARVNAGKELQAMGYGKPRDEDERSRGFELRRVIVVPGCEDETSSGGFVSGRLTAGNGTVSSSESSVEEAV